MKSESVGRAAGAGADPDRRQLQLPGTTHPPGSCSCCHLPLKPQEPTTSDGQQCAQAAPGGAEQADAPHHAGPANLEAPGAVPDPGQTAGDLDHQPARHPVTLPVIPSVRSDGGTSPGGTTREGNVTPEALEDLARPAIAPQGTDEDGLPVVSAAQAEALRALVGTTAAAPPAEHPMNRCELPRR
jgi:hypothetical protein